MLGNDIVDLSNLETQPGAQHPRFDSRVFNEEEQARLDGHADPHRLRWSYWAAKEATYKWLRKQDEDVIFSPQSMSVSFDNDSLEGGEVLVGQDRVVVKFLQHPEYVHALVHDLDTSGSIARFSVELEIDEANLCIVSEGKIPRLESKGTMLEVDLSFSHHGRYAAFVAQRGRKLDRERGAA
jgi:phosphopantetheinyl transferase